EKKTGVTIMQMNEGLDTGDILCIEEMDITSEDTAGSMFEKLAVLGADMLVRVIGDIELYRANAKKQDEAQATYAAMLDKNMANIDWSWDSEKIDCLIRGLNPFYIAKTTVGNSFIKIHKVARCSGKGKCGEVIESKKRLVVACGNNTALELIKVQGENGKAMDAADYLRGHPIETGTILGGE
ncbi:MAG: methionyl-tRNA formyltransferase, partial [Clostridia bacterium]|nr:methionyl-tRNA formyltransferase [Clostridia bacterium]